MEKVPERKWDAAQLESEAVTKKNLVEFLQQNASSTFLEEHRLVGKLDNVAKTKGKPDLIKAYNALFETKAFRDAAEESKKEAEKKAEAERVAAEEAAEAKSVAASSSASASAPKEEKIGYKKEVIKKGRWKDFPKKGDNVSVKYKGMLTDGKVFDTNMEKKGQPLVFKVGTGKVIRGWDEGLMKMSIGEHAKLTIDPDWAYGKKGREGVIPPNSTLIFEVELLEIK